MAWKAGENALWGFAGECGQACSALHAMLCCACGRAGLTTLSRPCPAPSHPPGGAACAAGPALVDGSPGPRLGQPGCQAGAVGACTGEAEGYCLSRALTAARCTPALVTPTCVYHPVRLHSLTCNSVRPAPSSPTALHHGCAGGAAEEGVPHRDGGQVQVSRRFCFGNARAYGTGQSLCSSELCNSGKVGLQCGKGQVQVRSASQGALTCGASSTPLQPLFAAPHNHLAPPHHLLLSLPQRGAAPVQRHPAHRAAAGGGLPQGGRRSAGAGVHCAVSLKLKCLSVFMFIHVQLARPRGSKLQSAGAGVHRAVS